MPRNAPLPFDAFLDVLRSRGYGIGLPEYSDMANLLEHWDRLHVSELGDALAALIGRSAEEVSGIRRLFDELYAPPPPPPPPPAPTVDRLAFLRRYAWSLALVAATVMLVAAGFAIFPRPPIQTNAPKPVVPAVTAPGTLNAVTIPPPPAPVLPPPPKRVERGPAAEAVGAGFLVALAVFWSMKVRDDRRVWAREAWSAVRAMLPGPYHYNDIVRGRSTHLPKADVEDAATLLGRVFSRNTLAREMDVPRTLRATLRRGLMPTLITKPRRVAETILVLQDVCQDMRPWNGKVEAFLSDLRRQGIALQRMYFDGDLSRLSDRPHRPAGAIDTVLRSRPDAPVLIISGGTGLAATLGDTDQTWVRQLANRVRKTWLTPVADVRLWPPEFTQLPLDVWPMTHLGLTNAARALAGLEGGGEANVRARIALEGRVTVEDIDRLKRLASLVPHPSPALLDMLRLRFAPDVSDAAILWLMMQADGPGAPIIRLKDEDLRQALNAVRRENPDLEAAARQAILGVLLDSEPAPGSAAHERWRIAVEVQRLLLADLDGAARETAASTDALRALRQGPMGSEVREALQIVPATPALNARVKEVAASTAHSAPPPADVAQAARAKRAPWSWPGLRELVPASLVAGLLLAGAVGLSALPVRTVDHVQEAYNLDYAPTPSVSTPQLSIMRRWRDAALPSRVDLYQGDRLFRSGIDLPDGAPTVVGLTSNDTGNYYQIRATLPESNLAVSKAVWVTSDRLAFVLIDASPWANVTITGGQTPTPAQQTPFTAALLPGTYQVHFENRGLTPPSTMDQSITVPSADNRLHVTMPGFDAARTVDTLMQRGAIQTRGR